MAIKLKKSIEALHSHLVPVLLKTETSSLGKRSSTFILILFAGCMTMLTLIMMQQRVLISVTLVMTTILLSEYLIVRQKHSLFGEQS